MDRIPPPFHRRVNGLDDDGHLVPGLWARPEFGVLARVPGWTFAEKITGTGFTVTWDGVTARSSVESVPQWPWLVPGLTEQVERYISQVHLGVTAAVFHCQVIGGGTGANPAVAALPVRGVLTDVSLHGGWLTRRALEITAGAVGLLVPGEAASGEPMTLAEGVRVVGRGFESGHGPFLAEGLIGTAPLGFLTRRGERIQVELLHADICRADAPALFDDSGNALAPDGKPV